jgi:hypothetical protein
MHIYLSLNTQHMPRSGPLHWCALVYLVHALLIFYSSLPLPTPSSSPPSHRPPLHTPPPHTHTPQVMFSQLVSSVVTTPALRDFLDVLCKGTCGAAAAAIPAAYMVRAFAEMYQPGASTRCYSHSSAVTEHAATGCYSLLQPPKSCSCSC